MTPEHSVTGAGAQSPLFRVVRGHPSDEELAALVAVLSAHSAPASPGKPTLTQSNWAAYWRGVRAPLLPGPGAWRASGRTG